MSQNSTRSEANNPPKLLDAGQLHATPPSGLQKSSLSQIAVSVGEIEEFVRALEDDEQNFRQQVSSLLETSRRRQAELSQRAEALTVVQATLSKLVTTLNQSASGLFEELNAFNNTIRVGEDTSAQLLSNLKANLEGTRAHEKLATE